MGQQRREIDLIERESRQKDFVKEAFQQRGHHFPPHREYEDQVVGLADARLIVVHFRVEHFPARIHRQFIDAHHRVEVFIVQIKHIHCVPVSFQYVNRLLHNMVIEAFFPGMVNNNHHTHG